MLDRMRHRSCLLSYLFMTIAAAWFPREVLSKEAYGELKVMAQVPSACTVTVPEIQLGEYNPTEDDVQVKANDNISVQCTNGTEYSIALDRGQGASGLDASIVTRKMLPDNGSTVAGLGPKAISYNLYKDDLCKEVWGDGANAVVSQVGTGLKQVLPVFACIPPKQKGISAGTYHDIVKVIIRFK